MIHLADKCEPVAEDCSDETQLNILPIPPGAINEADSKSSALLAAIAPVQLFSRF